MSCCVLRTSGQFPSLRTTSQDSSTTTERVFFFGCAMDPNGLKDVDDSPVLRRCFARHAKDYASLSSSSETWDSFVAAVNLMMETEPNVPADRLAGIATPVTNARLVAIPGMSHFAPIQRPDLFNRVLIDFLRD